MLVAIGAILTLAPVVYVALERAQMLKVGAVLLLVVVAALFAITAEAWRDLPQTVTDASIPAAELGLGDPARRPGLRRCGWWAEPGAEQLDP